MFKQLFFCCHEKGDKDDFSSINVDIENNSNINSKNIDILNSKNNIDKSCRPLNTNSKKRLYLKYSNKSLTKVAEENNNIETEKINKIKSKTKPLFQKYIKMKSLTCSKNNYQNKDKNNSIYIHNLRQERLSYTGIDKAEKINFQIMNKNSGQNSINLINNNGNPSLKDVRSFISFSNIIVRNKTNTNNRSKSNLGSDTEILSSCELILTGELFFNKEIKIDRLGIKNQNMDQSIGGKSQSINFNHKIYKRRDKELKFGIMKNNNEEKNIENQNSIKNNNQDNNNPINKIEKMNKKESDLSMSSIMDKTKKSDLDMTLNIPQNKINRFQNNNKTDNNIIIFTLKYNPNMEIFEFNSCQDSVPIELLLNYNFQLRTNLEYHILLGNVKMSLVVSKNIKNQNVINISIINGVDTPEKNANKDDKKNILYTFNPYEDKMPVTIGRVNCDINLSNISVSKLHAQINYINDTDEFVVSDLRSTNGTYLLLEKPLNFFYINRDLSLRIFESTFSIKYINFDL